MNDLTNLSNEELVSQLKQLSSKEREYTNLVVYRLAEMIRRRLYTELGYTFAYEYAVQALEYSNASTMRRTKAAKVIAILPDAYQSLVAGKISVSVLEIVADAIRSGHAKDLLGKVEGKTREEAIQIAAGYFPMKPAFISDHIKPVFVDRPMATNFTAKREEHLEISDKTTRVRSEVNTNSTENELMFRIKFYAKPALNSKIKRVKELLFAAEGNADLETVFERLAHLQIDHVVPWAKGWRTDAENMRTVCKAHNQMLARKVFGRRYIGQAVRQRRVFPTCDDSCGGVVP